MRYAIAIWNYSWKPEVLPACIHEFADHGFDAISFHPHQFTGDLARHLPAVAEALHSRNLVATVHGACSMDRAILRTVFDALREHLYAFTLDSAMVEDSRGRFHDAKRIAATLSYIQTLAAGTSVKLAVEDFPLDPLALEYFAADLGTVYQHSRTGVLVDVGHMHMRMKKEGSFHGLPVWEYFRALPCPLVEVHLHDNNGNTDQHGHFGFGSVPFADIAQSLKRLRFDGACTIEIAPGFHGSTPEASKPKAFESLQRWRELMAAATA